MKQFDKKKFEKKVKVMTIIWITFMLLYIGFSISSKFIDYEKFIPEKYFSFVLGVIMGLLMVCIVRIAPYIRAKNQGKLEEMFIKENDERDILINNKAGGLAMSIVILTLLFAAIVSLLFNETVFFALLFADIFVALIKTILYLYYSKHF
ncbi:MAG: hypothetical protein LBM93_09035 [Oscillospiraceae bacterium]|jgi:uncharacterized membrane protein|nr:hypothetical protein [Oscillospiraceae bacterium]